mgnify:CR=1 FL=1
MANTLRIKRRAAGGAAGAPASLANAELAFNEQDNTLYYGTGTGGAGGTATSVIAIGGSGAFVATTGAQTIAGVKTFTSTISGSIDGNAGTATKLATARTFSITGDGTGSASFDGSANASIALTLANSGATAGTYGSATQVGQVTVDAKGRVTAASNVAITFPVTSVAGRTGAITLTTSDVSEGTNLYYTDTRVRANRLDQLAAPTAAVALNSQRITGLADPTAAQDAATKNYVDLTVQGLDPKASVKAASTANIASLSGTMTIDGVALGAGDRVLVKDQTTTSANGVYVVAAGAWARSEDLSTWAEHVAAYLFVEQGTVNADVGFLCTVDAGGTLEIEASLAAPRVTRAPTGTPPPMPLAATIASGRSSGSASSCWKANQSPVRPAPVWISSTISRVPCARVRRRASVRNPVGRGTTPASPLIGSSTTAATSGPRAAASASRTCRRSSTISSRAWPRRRRLRPARSRPRRWPSCAATTSKSPSSSSRILSM